jgi:hypothetical protein
VQLFSHFSRLSCIVKQLCPDRVAGAGNADVGTAALGCPVERSSTASSSSASASHYANLNPNAKSSNSLPGAAFNTYSQPTLTGSNPGSHRHDDPSTRKPMSRLPIARNRIIHCTKSCHPPVDAVHSIENKSDKLAIFSLTQILKGVQQDRSLTVS